MESLVETSVSLDDRTRTEKDEDEDEAKQATLPAGVTQRQKDEGQQLRPREMDDESADEKADDDDDDDDEVVEVSSTTTSDDEGLDDVDLDLDDGDEQEEAAATPPHHENAIDARVEPPQQLHQDQDEIHKEGNDEEGSPVVLVVPPRPVLPKRMKKKMMAPPAAAEAPVVAVPPRPVLMKKRAATVNSSPELPTFSSSSAAAATRSGTVSGSDGLLSTRSHLQAEGGRRRTYGPTTSSSSPSLPRQVPPAHQHQQAAAEPAGEVQVVVPPRPRLPTRSSSSRSSGDLPRLTPRLDDTSATKNEGSAKNESDPARVREEDLRRRQQEMERLAPFAPKLLYTDSYYINRQQQQEESLDELRRLREEERRLAIEREREKARKVVNVEELNLRPKSVRGPPSPLSKSDQGKQVKEGAATLRRNGVLTVRALEEFDGKLIIDPEKKKIAGKSKRKGLKFKPNDIITVTAVHEEDGLYFGTLSKTDKSGWFPSYYVVIK